MMPFIQGDSRTLPDTYRHYSDIVDANYLEKGEIGYLTIDERFTEAGKSQRGFNSAGINRNVHIEVGRREKLNCWGSGGSDGDGSNGWGGRFNTLLDDSTMVLIANSLSGTCKVWDNIEKRYTKDGDLSAYIDDYPEYTGRLLNKGELVKMSIFSPHECIEQKKSANRQFFRIVGKGVTGRENYFTINPLLQ
jgi:hypothetical protein